MKYFPWVDSNDQSYAMIALKIPQNLNALSGKFNGNNQSLKGLFPKRTIFNLYKHPAHGNVLGDFIRNTDHMLIVSARLKKILEENSDDFEFYPVSIRNRQKKIVKEPYYFAHLLYSAKCLNLKASDVHWSALEKGRAQYITKLVLDPKKIPKRKKIFRLGEMKSLIMVREDLAQEIYVKNKCRGMLFLKTELYGKDFR